MNVDCYPVLMAELKGWEKFKDALVAAGYQQVDLASDLGVSDSAVSNWARGKAKPRARDCIRIARLLGREPEEVLDWFKRNPQAFVRLQGSTRRTGRLGEDESLAMWNEEGGAMTEEERVHWLGLMRAARRHRDEGPERP